MICSSSSSSCFCFSSRKLGDGHGDDHETHPRCLHVQLVPDPKECSWLHHIHMKLWVIERATRGRWSKTNQQEKKFSFFSSSIQVLVEKIFILLPLNLWCVCTYLYICEKVSILRAHNQKKKRKDLP